MKKIRIATRQSRLALVQAEAIKNQLKKIHARIEIEIIAMSTEGDRFLQKSLANIGGKGLFVKELEQAILENKADIAVHSLKDIPVDFPDGLGLTVICKRSDPRDAFVANNYTNIAQLPKGACIGTSSLRRQSLVKSLYPHLNVENLRGNVETRLQKLDNGQFTAIILAAAGLKRLGLEDRIKEFLPEQQFIPAVGQGTLAIESRVDDKAIINLIKPLEDGHNVLSTAAERAFNKHIGGGCQVPVAAYAKLNEEQLYVIGYVGKPDGSYFLRDMIAGCAKDAEVLGETLAKNLLAKGADKILKTIYEQ